MSSQPPIAPSPQAQRRLDEHRASREAVHTVCRYIWLSLCRHGVPYRDRADLVQAIVRAALEAWPSYDAEIANLQKWLNGITLHHVQRWRMRCATDPRSEKATH